MRQRTFLPFGCRNRTCTRATESQTVASPDTQIDAQKPRHGFEICEVIEAWSELPEPLRAAVLAIIRSHKGELSTVERRQPSNGRASREAAMLARSALSGSETDCGQLEERDTRAGMNHASESAGPLASVARCSLGSASKGFISFCYAWTAIPKRHFERFLSMS